MLHYCLEAPAFKHYLIYPEWLGRYRRLPNHQVDRPRGMLRAYNLHLVFGGRGRVRTRSRTYELTEGMGFLYDREAEQSYGADPSDPWDVRWVHAVGPGVDLLFSGLQLADGWIFRFRNAEKLRGLTDEMLALCEPYDPAHDLRLSVLLYELLADIRQHAEPWNMPAAAADKQRVMQTAAYIRTCCGQKLTLADLAARAGYSPQHFSRVFHRHMGRTVTRYITECRIAAAKRLLVSGTRSVKDIALACGFGQSSYFIKLFREAEGMTPEQFRNINLF